MLPPEHDFFTLDQFIGANFHQDVDLLADTIPEVVAQYARLADPDLKHRLLEEITAFELRHKDDLEEAFYSTFPPDVDPVMQDQDVASFFTMVRAILADPSVYPRFENGKDFG